MKSYRQCNHPQETEEPKSDIGIPSKKPTTVIQNEDHTDDTYYRGCFLFVSGVLSFSPSFTVVLSTVTCSLAPPPRRGGGGVSPLRALPGEYG